MAREKILVVDDDLSVGETIKRMLSAAGYRVAVEGDGDKGLERFADESFDLVLTDIMMPAMSGLEFINRLRRDVSTDLPVVVITAHTSFETAVELIRHGAQGFVTKPFTRKELLSTVEEVLRKSAVVKENIKLKGLLPIFEVNKRLLVEHDIDRLLDMVVEESARYTGAELASIMLLDDDGSLMMKAYRTRRSGAGGLDDGSLKVMAGEGFVGRVAEQKEPVVLDSRTETDPQLKEMMRKRNIRSALCLPIVMKDVSLGVLNLINFKRDHPFSHSDLEIATVLCGQAAIAIENARLYKRLSGTYMGIIATLASTIEARDPHTGGHAARMVRYSEAIAREMGVSGRELETIRRAALLHDIGKIGIPDGVLLKKGTFTDEDFAVIKEHPEIGGRILNNMEGLEEVALLVNYHHEHYNGRGYPHGVGGDAIPLGARIIAVADAFEVMTSARPYRRAVSESDAVAELRRMSGTQFDPKVVEAFEMALARMGRFAGRGGKVVSPKGAVHVLTSPKRA
ncbi:MAG TPA: response regulator [Deltaproteobacteria bacterium]|nr:response regulator [Deltaproteobacteria bacterium]